MGISTLQSYRGAQVFEAIGLDKDLVDRYFTGTVSRIGGVNLEILAEEAIQKHRHAFTPVSESVTELAVGGNYQFRANGEYHLYNPDTITKLQHAVQRESFATFEEYAQLIDAQNRQLCTLRGLLEIKTAEQPIPLEEVEPAKEIVKRFATGAMSFGSISKEAHETLALAMNRIGGKSNTGEGGEDEARYYDGRRSAIKQVASGRFGVTANYLVNADELQIKMAQGAKPGEGGQLPGHKVDDVIARVRHSIPGVGLISPPPHHDIYSIEDLAQLIYDLKNVNPKARVSVKLVAEVGVGTVAAGVAKAHADAILISGDTGGTGASPLSSHQTRRHPLGTRPVRSPASPGHERSSRTRPSPDRWQTPDWPRRRHRRPARRRRVRILHRSARRSGLHHDAQVPPQHLPRRHRHAGPGPPRQVHRLARARHQFLLLHRRTGAPLHGADGLPHVRRNGRPRRYARTAPRYRSLARAAARFKKPRIDLSAILYAPPAPRRVARRCVDLQDHGLDQALDYKLIDHARDALDHATPIEIKLPIRNIHRTVGAMLSGEIARRYGSAGLPDDTIRFQFTGSAGQSFGAFLAKGVTLELEGDANDYTGKGLSGGRIIVFPSRNSTFLPEENIIAGNVALYGATSGEAFFNGRAGERFAVRNSGATSVVEGLGDHGCEYMTNGLVVVLGKCGRNFAAGMSGGLAFVLDEIGDFAAKRCNQKSVDLESAFEDSEMLFALIARHAEATASPRARWILESWEQMLPKFIKIYPREYKRVLAKPQAMEVAHG